jgi:quercetin dioxygenase-like cupin family protein
MKHKTHFNLQAFMTAAQTAFLQRIPYERVLNRELLWLAENNSSAVAFPDLSTNNSQPLAEQLGEALRHTVHLTQTLGEALAPLAHVLPWKSADGDHPSPSGASWRTAMADIVGPLAPLRSNLVRLRLALIASNTFSSSHHHTEAEFAHIVSGSATWIISGIPRRFQPGAFILTPPQAVHAIHTEQQPVLALCLRTTESRCEQAPRPGRHRGQETGFSAPGINDEVTFLASNSANHANEEK